MMNKTLIFFVLLIGFSFPLHAKDYKQQFATYGVGGESCTEYQAARNQGGEEEDTYRQWLAGYISGFNLIIDNNYDIFGSTDFEGMMTWLDNRCKKYPRENITNAVARFTEIVFSYRKQIKPTK